jgi:hypothetical protein
MRIIEIVLAILEITVEMFDSKTSKRKMKKMKEKGKRYIK